MSTENHFRHPSAMVTGDKSSPATSFYTLRKKMSAHLFAWTGTCRRSNPIMSKRGREGAEETFYRHFILI